MLPINDDIGLVWCEEMDAPRLRFGDGGLALPQTYCGEPTNGVDGPRSVQTHPL